MVDGRSRSSAKSSSRVPSYPEKTFFDVGEDAVLPDEAHVGVAEIASHEVAGADGGVPVVVQQAVGLSTTSATHSMAGAFSRR